MAFLIALRRLNRDANDAMSDLLVSMREGHLSAEDFGAFTGFSGMPIARPGVYP